MNSTNSKYDTDVINPNKISENVYKPITQKYNSVILLEQKMKDHKTLFPKIVYLETLR